MTRTAKPAAVPIRATASRMRAKLPTPVNRRALQLGTVSYFVLVDKSGPGAKFYDLTYHCWTGPDGTGVHTGTSLIIRQSE
mgnify:CR=1 FL=1